MLWATQVNLILVVAPDMSIVLGNPTRPMIMPQWCIASSVVMCWIQDRCGLPACRTIRMNN